jgi:hypothetical protein
MKSVWLLCKETRVKDVGQPMKTSVLSVLAGLKAGGRISFYLPTTYQVSSFFAINDYSQVIL